MFSMQLSKEAGFCACRDCGTLGKGTSMVTMRMYVLQHCPNRKDLACGLLLLLLWF